VRDSAAIRAAILTGTGSQAFCAGADLGLTAAGHRREAAGKRMGHALS
jgi:enoyl-CoA hydratase/carnithine racemase